MNTVLTDAGEMLRGGRASRARPTDAERAGGSATETARRNLLKELNRERVDNAETLARLFSGDDRARFLYMPLFALVLKNITVHGGSRYRGDDYVTKVKQEYLEGLLSPLLQPRAKPGTRAITGEEKTLTRFRLFNTFVRYNRFATEVLERNA